MNDDIKRVFLHEVGHFIAHELNARNFHGKGVNGIKIYPCPNNDQVYCGNTSVNLAENRSEDKPPDKEELPETLAALVYGCFFQSYYKKSSFEACIQLNGGDDKNAINASLVTNGRDHLILEIEKIDNDYLNKLKQDKVLETLLKLDPYKYLKKVDSNKYEVDMDILKNDNEEFLVQHKETYQAHVKSYFDLFEQDDLKVSEQSNEDIS